MNKDHTAQDLEMVTPPQRTEQKPDELSIAYMSGLYDGKKKRPWVDLTDTQIENVYFEMVQEHRGAPMPWGQVQFGKALLKKFREVNQ